MRNTLNAGLSAALLGGAMMLAAPAFAQEAATAPTPQNFNANASVSSDLSANSNSKTVRANTAPRPANAGTQAEIEITRQLNAQQASLGNSAPGQEGMLTPNADLNNTSVNPNKTPQSQATASVTATKTVQDPNSQLDTKSAAGKTKDMTESSATTADDAKPAAQAPVQPAPAQ